MRRVLVLDILPLLKALLDALLALLQCITKIHAEEADDLVWGHANGTPTSDTHLRTTLAHDLSLLKLEHVS